MKTQQKDRDKERNSSRTNNEVTEVVIENYTLDRDAIAVLAYLYWQDRGCSNGSPDEDWFRAEDELRRRLSAAANGRGNPDSDRV